MTPRMTQDGRLGQRHGRQDEGKRRLRNIKYIRCVVCCLGEEVYGTKLPVGYEVAVGRIGVIGMRGLPKDVVAVFVRQSMHPQV